MLELGKGRTIGIELIMRLLKEAVIGEGERDACRGRDVEGKVDRVGKVDARLHAARAR